METKRITACAGSHSWVREVEVMDTGLSEGTVANKVYALNEKLKKGWKLLEVMKDEQGVARYYFIGR